MGEPAPLTLPHHACVMVGRLPELIFKTVSWCSDAGAGQETPGTILAEGDNEYLKRCGSAEIKIPLVNSTAIRRCRRTAKSIVAVPWWRGFIPCVSCGQRR
jgi:hypothetical protein